MKASIWLALCSGLSRRGLKSPACKRSSRLKPTLFWRVRFSGLGFREAAISIAAGADSYDSNFAYTYNQVI